jgi:hypothetical protein
LSCPNCGRPFSHAPKEDNPGGQKGDNPGSQNTTSGNEIYNYISTHSTRIFGACLALVGLFRLVEGLKKISIVGDELLSIDAVAFLFAANLAYHAMRARGDKRSAIAGRAAQAIFLAALGVLTVICVMIALRRARMVAL